jgi:ATP phosphoribosyltransferase regulatory subunit
MTVVDRWLLPDGVEEVLPPGAAKLESVRRSLLDLYSSWGYGLVIPPIIEFLESLLTGSGSDVDLQTFRITDQNTGRTMGLRADITPQVARIDAHSLLHEGPTRFCYAETVVHAAADNMLASRIPIRVGAELFGHEGQDSDLEIVSLLVESLVQLSFADIHLELGDVGIYSALMADVEISDRDELRLFNAIQRKAHADIAAIIAELGLTLPRAKALKELPLLVGDRKVLMECEQLMGDVAGVPESLRRLAYIEEMLRVRYPKLNIHFDLSELRGYNYHTGIVFAAYLPGHGQVAKGGRYDQVGEVFGRPRPATGFDMDLKVLAQLAPEAQDEGGCVSVKYQKGLSESERNAVWERVQALRADGSRVVFELDGQIETQGAIFSARLHVQNGKVVIDDL